MPNPSARSGTTTTPPPRPVNAPRKPATTAPLPTSIVNSKTLMRSPPGCHRKREHMAGQNGEASSPNWLGVAICFSKSRSEEGDSPLRIDSPFEELAQSRLAMADETVLEL